MAVAGLVRDRRHIFGRQSVMGTKVPGTRAYPFKGVPDHNLNWTDEDLDTGSVYTVAAPTRRAPDLTAPLTAPSIYYNDLTAMLAAVFGNGETPTGAGSSKTWHWKPAPDGSDEFDPFTYTFGDDVTTDWFEDGDGVLETLEITGPEGLGPLSASMGWRFGSVSSTGSTDSPASMGVPVAEFVDTAGVPIYLKDGGIYIATSLDDLFDTQISDALHTFILRITNTLDLKRYANADQEFDIDAYGRSAVLIEMIATWAKTSDIVGTGSESDAWMSDEAQNRYIGMIFTSKAEAETDVPYSWTFSMPARYYTRTEGEVGGNTVVVLTAHAFFEAEDFEGAFETTLVNTLAGADL